MGREERRMRVVESVLEVAAEYAGERVGEEFLRDKEIRAQR